MSAPRRNPRQPGRDRNFGGERLDGIHVVLEALRAGRRELGRVRVSKDPGPDLDVVLAEARRAGVPVETVEANLLGTQDGAAVRIVLDAGPLPEVSIEEILAIDGPNRRIVLLDGVEDPQNLGALARVAEASGAIGLVTGRRRSAPLSPAASRASAGALEWLPVARVPNLGRAINTLKKNGFWLIGADPEASESIFEPAQDLLRGDLGVVLGAEGTGLRPSILDALDFRVRIPMAGRVASLNVSAAGAVLLYELVRRCAREPEVPVDAGKSR